VSKLTIPQKNQNFILKNYFPSVKALLHGCNNALSCSGQRQRLISFSACKYPCIIVNAFCRKAVRTLTLSLQLGHARKASADGANRQICKESKQLATLLLAQVMELNRVMRFNPHSAPSGFKKYKFLILSVIKKQRNIFKYFEYFFISLRIKNLRFMKRLGAESGF